MLGGALGPQAVTELALTAWRLAEATLRPLGRSAVGLIVHHDQDPVFRRLCQLATCDVALLPRSGA